MDEPARSLANLEISCPMERRRSSPTETTISSLDLYMHRSKQLTPRDSEEVSFVFSPGCVRTPNSHNEIGSNNSDHDTTATCDASMSTFQSSTSVTTTTAPSIIRPLHQESSPIFDTQAVSRSSSLEIKKRPLMKNVQFLLDEYGNVVSDYLDAEGPLTEEEKQAVWWQPLEFKLFRRYCKKAAQIARNSEYAEHFTKVYDACSQKHITDVREHCHISRTHARGLEVVVFPTLVQARKLVIKGVVKTQEKLPATMDAEQKAKVLSATSRCLTGRSRLLSRVFAVGDEEVARDCYYCMS